MNIVKRLVMVAVATCAAGASYASHSKTFMNGTTGNVTAFTVPDWLEISSAATTTVGTSTQVQFTMNGTLPGSFSDLICFEAQFGDRLVVLPLGSYTFQSSPTVTANHVAVYSLSSGSIISSGTFTVSGNVVTLQVPTSALNGGAATLAATCYLPAGTNLNSLTMNFGDQLGDSYGLAPNPSGAATFLPLHPGLTAQVGSGMANSLISQSSSTTVSLPIYLPWILPPYTQAPPLDGQATWNDDLGPPGDYWGWPTY